jgi:hypothetical protein
VTEIDTRTEQEKCLEIKDIDGLILALQIHREKHGNIPVYIDLSAGQEEGCYDIDAVLYATDEYGEESVDLIVW